MAIWNSEITSSIFGLGETTTTRRNYFSTTTNSNLIDFYPKNYNNNNNDNNTPDDYWRRAESHRAGRKLDRNQMQKTTSRANRWFRMSLTVSHSGFNLIAQRTSIGRCASSIVKAKVKVERKQKYEDEGVVPQTLSTSQKTAKTMSLCPSKISSAWDASVDSIRWRL